MVWRTAGMVVMSPVPAPLPPSTRPPVQRDNSSVATPSPAYPTYGAAMARMTVAMVLMKTIAVSTTVRLYTDEVLCIQRVIVPWFSSYALSHQISLLAVHFLWVILLFSL